MNAYFVYILASKKNGTLYVGFTDDLSRRIYEHKNKINEGFTKQYNVDLLVYFEKHSTPEDAVKRENQLKKRKRKWKIELIEKLNLDWNDLSLDPLNNLSFMKN
jgi:putative endonuclease